MRNYFFKLKKSFKKFKVERLVSLLVSNIKKMSSIKLIESLISMEILERIFKCLVPATKRQRGLKRKNLKAHDILRHVFSFFSKFTDKKIFSELRKRGKSMRKNEKMGKL